MLVFVLALIACALSASAYENISYNYTYAATGEVLEDGYTNGVNHLSFALPNVTWDLQLKNNYSTFGVVFPDINYTFKRLDVNATAVALGQIYEGEFGTGTTNRYVVKYAYAMEIPQLSSRTYTVTMHSSVPLSRPYIFQCPFNFTSKAANTSSCDVLTASLVSGTTYDYRATTSGFSAFFLTNETNVPVSPGPSYTPTGGGGGGGGGGAHTPILVYVTPTPEGATVSVYNGDELVVIYNGAEYHFRVIKLQSQTVTLRSLANYLTYDISIGDDKRLGLESFMSDDVRVSMHIVNNFAMLTFRTPQAPAFSFPLLPPKPRTTPTPQPVGGAQPIAPQIPAPQYQPTTPVTTPTVPAEALPESPVNLMTILLGLVFVALLIGGFVLYRVKLSHMEKPPTVGAAGQLGGSLSSQVVRPAPMEGALPAQPAVAARPTLMQRMVERTEEEFRSAEQKVAALVQPQTRPVAYHIPHAKMLELERFIYHAYSLGYGASQVKAKLLEHGWPEELIDQVLEQIKVAK